MRQTFINFYTIKHGQNIFRTITLKTKLKFSLRSFKKCFHTCKCSSLNKHPKKKIHFYLRELFSNFFLFSHISAYTSKDTRSLHCFFHTLTHTHAHKSKREQKAQEEKKEKLSFFTSTSFIEGSN